MPRLKRKKVKQKKKKKEKKKGEEKQAENIERENLIKNDLRIRGRSAERLRSSQSHYFAHILLLDVFFFRFCCTVPNKGNHHAGIRDTRGYRRWRCSYHTHVIVSLRIFLSVFPLPSFCPCRCCCNACDVCRLLRFICSCFINITFDFLIQLRQCV